MTPVKQPPQHPSIFNTILQILIVALLSVMGFMFKTSLENQHEMRDEIKMVNVQQIQTQLNQAIMLKDIDKINKEVERLQREVDRLKR